MHTDFDWVHAHTRLHVRAQEWQTRNRDSSYLLGGSDLKDAESWLARAASQPIQATPLQQEYLIASRLAATRRSRIVSGVLASFTVVAIGLAIYAFTQRNVANTQRDDANQARKLADSNANEARIQRDNANTQRNEAQHQTRIADANRLAATSIGLKDTQPDLAFLLSAEATRYETTFDTRNAQLTLFQSTPNLARYLNRADPHAGFVRAISFSTDGRRFAVAREDALELWDATSWKPIWTQKQKDQSFHDAAFSPDGATLAVIASTNGSDGEALRIWQVESRRKAPVPKEVLLHDIPAHPASLAFNSDGSLFAVRSLAGITIWALPSLTPIRKLPPSGKNGVLWGMAFSPADPALFATLDDDGAVSLFNLRSGKQAEAFHSGRAAGDGEGTVAFNPDGTEIAATAERGKIGIWRIERSAAPSLLGKVQVGDDGLVAAVNFSPDSHSFAAASNHGAMGIWDARTLQSRLAQPVPRTISVDISALAFSRDGRFLLSGLDNGRLIAWNTQTSQSHDLIDTVSARHSAIRNVAFSHNHGLLAAADANGTVQVWDVATRALLHHIEIAGALPSEVRGLAFSANDASLLVVPNAFGDHYAESPKSIAFCLDVRGRTFARVDCPGIPSGDWTKRQSESAAIAGVSSTLAAIAYNPSNTSPSRIELFRPGTSRPILMPNPPVHPTSIAIADEGSTIAAAGMAAAGSQMLWHIAGEHASTVPLAQSAGSSFFDLEFNRSGSMLAGASYEGLYLWNTTTGARIGNGLEQNRRTLNNVAFSPDGNTIALSVYGGEVQLADVETQRPIGLPIQADLEEFSEGPSGVAFSPDGQLLAYGGDNDTVHLWGADPADWAARACQVANRNLSLAEWQRYMGDAPYHRTCPQLPAESALSTDIYNHR
jgi:WD40 repeat protein